MGFGGLGFGVRCSLVWGLGFGARWFGAWGSVLGGLGFVWGHQLVHPAEAAAAASGGGALLYDVGLRV